MSNAALNRTHTAVGGFWKKIDKWAKHHYDQDAFSSYNKINNAKSWHVKTVKRERALHELPKDGETYFSPTVARPIFVVLQLSTGNGESPPGRRRRIRWPTLSLIPACAQFASAVKTALSVRGRRFPLGQIPLKVEPDSLD